MDSEDSKPSAGVDDIGPIDAPPRTLSPISSNAMNTLHTNPTPAANSYNLKTSNGTIRTVTSDSIHLDTTESNDSSPRREKGKTDMPHSTIKQSITVPAIPTTHSQPSLTNQNLPVGSNGILRTISAEFGPARIYPSTQVLEESNGAASPSNGNTPQWSSAVGRANLGKSGRVIERLMGENDMLKRDLNLEKLRAEESKQAVKMAEGRMEGLVAEYEGRLHDAAINKTLLKRRERQLTDLKSQIEGEKQRADAAVESEKGWREAMEQLEKDSKRKVDEAQLYAALMEGRNKTMTNHWKEQGAEVSRTVGKLGKEIEVLVEERKLDDQRMNMLQGLCEQQDEELLKLRKEKENIGNAFERYKAEQEELLRSIKDRASAQERKNEEILLESQRVLGELKWALAVKRNVKGAQ